MKEAPWMVGSAEEVGAKLQESYDRMLESSRKWAQMLTFDPQPQTGLTPKDVVWRKNKSKLYRYVGKGDFQYRTPILFIYALINKPYILDLIPQNSLIEHLVESGFDVYLLDWGEFAWEDRNITFGDLVYEYVARAVQKVCQYSKTNELTIAGYCMGGTIATMYASLFSQPIIKNIIYLSAPIDFSDAGLSSLWLQGPGYDVNKIADTFELIPKEFIDMGVKMLKPVKNYWGTYTRLWKSIDEGTSVEAWKALNKWVNDNINFPGEIYRQWIRDLYQENKLVKNELVIKRQTVIPANIGANLLVMAGELDHLVLPHQCSAIMNLSSSQDKTYHEFPVGHGGLVFGNYAKREVYPVMTEWLAEHS